MLDEDNDAVETAEPKSKFGDAGKTDKMDVSVVEEAVAQQKRAKGHRFPYESGLGTSGHGDNADLEPYRRTAKENKTTLPDALHDFASMEGAWRQHGPATAIELVAKKLGQDPLAVANSIVEHFSDPQKRAAAQNFIDGHEISASIRKFENHPKNRYMRDPQARLWMGQYVSNGHTAGLTNDAAIQKAYGAYQVALRAHGATQKLEDGMSDRQRDTEAKYAAKIAARMAGQ